MSLLRPEDRYPRNQDNALAMAYNMGRDDVIYSGDYRLDMFVYASERAAYDRGYQQEVHDLQSWVMSREQGDWKWR